MSVTGMFGPSFGMNVHLEQAGTTPIAQILRVCFKAWLNYVKYVIVKRITSLQKIASKTSV
jgi:hypothetical protein